LSASEKPVFVAVIVNVWGEPPAVTVAEPNAFVRWSSTFS